MIISIDADKAFDPDENFNPMNKKILYFIFFIIYIKNVNTKKQDCEKKISLCYVERQYNFPIKK